MYGVLAPMLRVHAKRMSSTLFWLISPRRATGNLPVLNIHMRVRVAASGPADGWWIEDLFLVLRVTREELPVFIVLVYADVALVVS